MNRAATDVPVTVSPFAPFRHRMFALLWTATLISNIGTWMHDVSAAWLMTSLSPSPFVVSLVQASTTAAMALFALPAGAMADLFDRRRLLISLTAIKCVLAMTLGMLAFTGRVDAWILLAITFLLGTASAFMAPVWQSVVPSLVPRAELKPAVALNSAGLNVARAIGPTLGGLIILASGAGAAFLLNGLSELVILAAILWWSPAVVPAKRLPENFLPAIAAGVRYAMHAPALKIVLWRAVAFFVFASAFWALLPLIVRTGLKADASLYGVMVGAVGLGAVGGALLLPRIDRYAGAHRLVMLGTLGMAAVLLTLGLVPMRAAALVSCLAAGVCWIFVLSSLNVAAQNALPDWVRGRGLSIYGMVFFGAMTAGSLVWGAVATWAGLGAALVAAGVGSILALVAVHRQVLSQVPVDLSPAGHWPEPMVHASVEGDAGPVMVFVEYRIDESRAAEFAAVMSRMAGERRRDGAYQWALTRDTADPALFIEFFLVESWAEHERQHARVTKADADVQGEARAFHVGEQPPVVRHFITVSN
ncbi:MAG: MFS transporter [Burkholderiales bacterium]|jgi:MFS family permease|nr:MFS transporter [Burkholderiales bacterium]